MTKFMTLASAIAALPTLAHAQTAEVYLTATQDGNEITTVRPGETFTISVSATGDEPIFYFDLLVSAIAGTDRIEAVNNLVDNPTGSNAFFNGPAGQGIVPGSFGVDRRDSSVDVLVTDDFHALDNLPFFSFDVTVKADATRGKIRYTSQGGSGPFIDSGVAYAMPSGIVYLLAEYASIDFKTLDIRVIPAPASLSLLACTGLVATRRRR